MMLFTAHQHAPDFIGHVHPLVQVKGQRVGPLHPGHQVSCTGSQGSPRAKCTINVEPKTLLLADIGQRLQIVDGAGVGRPRRANDAERPMALLAVLGYGDLQRLKVDLEIVVDRYET